MGYSIDAAWRFEDKYQHVRDLQGFERSFDLDISFMSNQYSQYSGFELSLGIGAGLGFGFSNTKSSVLAFTESDLTKIANTIIEGEKEFNSLMPKTLNPLYIYLTLKPNNNGYDLYYNITEFRITPFSFLDNYNETFNSIYSKYILKFEKVDKTNFYYKTKTVNE